MSNDSSLVPAVCGGSLPIARMRALYKLDDVEKRLDKLPSHDHDHLRATYQRMLDKGADRFQVKPVGLPAMEHLYDELPNFTAVLDDVKRQLALKLGSSSYRCSIAGRPPGLTWKRSAPLSSMRW